MEIKYYEDQYLESLKELLQLSFPNTRVCKKGKCPSTDIELICVIDEKVVGYLVLNRIFDIVRDCKYFYVNYVCVHPDFRRSHIATKMFEEVFTICKNENVSYLELTSSPSKIGAHELYHKLGFQVRETTVFQKEIL